MSILINGLEMPPSCSKCPLVTEYYEGGPPVCCLLDKYADTSGLKLDDCPLAHATNARPVVSGKWIPYSTKDCLYYCSNCNALPTTKTKYCPNCGADMREGEK